MHRFLARPIAAFTISLSSFACIPEQTTPRVATHILFIQQPATNSAALDSLGTVRVAFLDDENSIVTSKRDEIEITLSVSDTTIHLMGRTRASAVNGVATFTDLVVDRAGSDYRLIGRAAGFNTALSTTFRVRPGVAGALRFGKDVSNTIAGTLLDTVTVLVVDRAANVDTASTVQVTISAPGDSMAGAVTRNAVKGVATFPRLVLYRARRNQLLIATAPGLQADSSNVFSVNMAAVTELHIYDSPWSGTPVFGVDGGHAYQPTVGTMFTVQVGLADEFGNRVPVECNLICFSLLGPIVPATIALGENPSGATMTTVNSQTRLPEHGYDWTWGVVIDKPGVGYTVVVTAPPYKPVTSVPFAVVPPGQ